MRDTDPGIAPAIPKPPREEKPTMGTVHRFKNGRAPDAVLERFTATQKAVAAAVAFVAIGGGVTAWVSKVGAQGVPKATYDKHVEDEAAAHEAFDSDLNLMQQTQIRTATKLEAIEARQVEFSREIREDLRSMQRGVRLPPLPPEPEPRGTP